MIKSYDRVYLGDVMDNLGAMMDYGINILGLSAEEMYTRFISSGIAGHIERGHPRYLSGLSGIELAMMATGRNHVDAAALPRGPEYWAGWALAYLQWDSGLKFSDFQLYGLGIEKVLDMFNPYHEADITKFACDARRILEHSLPSDSERMKRLRKASGLTQEDLAEKAGTSVRAIRAYEQNTRALSKAEAGKVMNLLKVFGGKLLVFFLAITIMGCGGRTALTRLDDIESYIQESPDSALVEIQRIDTCQLTSTAAKAKYSLLRAMAYDKNYIDTTDLSIIEPAVEYFSKHGPRKDRMLAKYYQGRIFSNRKDYPQAILSFKNSLKDVDSADWKYLGFNYAAISEAFNLSYNDAEELQYALKADECFEMLGDSGHLAISKIQLAQAYHNNLKFKEADSLYTSVFANRDSSSYSSIRAMLALVDSDLHSRKAHIERDVELLEYIRNLSGPLPLESEYEYTYALMLLGREKEASVLLDSLSSLPKDFSTLGWRYLIEKKKGNYEYALYLDEEYSKKQDEVVVNQLKQSIFKFQRDFYESESETARQKATIANLRLTILVVVFILLSICGFVFYKNKRREDKEETERLRDSVNTVYRMLSDANGKEQSRLNLQNAYIDLYRVQFQDIGKLYGNSAMNEDSLSKEISKEAQKRINSLISEITGRADKQKQFEDRLNADLDGIVSKIRKCFPEYNDEWIRFICYLISGFDTSTIAILMNMTKDNVRQRKSRIRKNINKYTGEDAWIIKAFLN